MSSQEHALEESTMTISNATSNTSSSRTANSRRRAVHNRWKQWLAVMLVAMACAVGLTASGQEPSVGGSTPLNPLQPTAPPAVPLGNNGNPVAPMIVSLEPVAQTAVERALASKLSVDFQEVPLGDVVTYLAETTKVQFFVSEKKLEEIGITLEEPITLVANDLKLATILEMLCDSHNLDLNYIDYDNRIEITSNNAADSLTDARVYDVRAIFSAYEMQNGEKLEADQLIELTASSVIPTAWDEVGGIGSITSFGGRLVITQSYPAHRKVDQFLRKLARSLEVDPDAVRVTK